MRKIFYICCVLLCAACAKAPTDAQLQDLCRNAGFAVAGQKDDAAKQAAFRQTMEEGSKAFDIHRIAPAQIDMMFNDGGATLDDMLREWFQPVLEQKALAKGEEGLTFSFYRWKYLPSAYRYEPRREEGWEVYKALITAPGFGEWLAVHPDYADDIVRGAAQIDGDAWVKWGMVDEVVALVKSSLPDKAALSSMNVFNKAFVAKQLPDETKNAIRESVLAQYKALLQTERYSKGDRREEVENGIHYLESPYATGTLVGNAAPALDFLWISGGKEKSLEDFKGKVVVLDFWATKCGPCISAFPHMRELREHYARYPVEIIGVTSIMGYHHDAKTGKFISTEGKPEYEMELMQRFMKDMGMTWRVAFSEQWVMNADYGVQGIPHLAVLDAQGNVRYNGVALAELPQDIDSLLKEAGLPCPGKPIEWNVE